MPDELDTDTVQRNREGGTPRRRYDSALRQAQAERTRRAVLDAGRELITERGYARTTMREIAARAGVVVETVYQHFRSKPALLRTLLDDALGGQGEVPVAERDWVRDVLARPDARTKLATAAEKIAGVYQPLAPVYLAMRAAAQADAGAEEIWSARKAERLDGMGAFARHLIDTGELRADLDADQVRDTLFALTSPELYGLLVLELGWPADRYAGWLADTLAVKLLRQR